MSTETAMTDAEKRAVWDVLVVTCAARPSQWPEFAHHFPQCREFRFQGDLGFGGKVWFDRSLTSRQRVYVTCYAEDENPERLAQVAAANATLAAVPLA